MKNLVLFFIFLLISSNLFSQILDFENKIGSITWDDTPTRVNQKMLSEKGVKFKEIFDLDISNTQIYTYSGGNFLHYAVDNRSFHFTKNRELEFIEIMFYTQNNKTKREITFQSLKNLICSEYGKPDEDNEDSIKWEYSHFRIVLMIDDLWDYEEVALCFWKY